MPADLDHIIVHATDPRSSAEFLAALVGAAVLPDWGPFVRVQTSNHVTLDYVRAGRRDRPSARVALLVERQSGCAREDVVGGEKWRADVDRRGCDPQVVGMGSIMERVARSATGESQLGERREEPTADRNDRGCLDRLIEAVAARRTPSGHEGAVSELANGHSSQEDLVSGHQADLRLEPGTAATAERRAEHRCRRRPSRIERSSEGLVLVL